ncbi:MAG: ABC transporter ATP-binding protein [bacterium]|nr:ABC transporter ATP-binding protein [bacterium]
MRSGNPLLSVSGLTVRFPVRRGGWRRPPRFLTAVQDVSFDVRPGETVALVGESGCGKSTTGRALLRISDERAIESGAIRFQDHDLLTLRRAELRPIRRQMQIIFQDPAASLNPRMPVIDIIGEPLRVHRVVTTTAELERRVASLMERVGLDVQTMAYRYPHEFSGGQKQRIGIARAIALDPAFIVCDEPTSALDVSIQAQILALLRKLQRTLGAAYLFISHNLAAVEQIADRIGVMYLGRLVEFGTTEQVIGNPRHPYTQALLSAVPVSDPVKQRTRQRIRLAGDVPSPVNPPSGCAFHPRCPLRQQLGAAEAARCQADAPILRSLASSGQRVACHHVTD